MQLVGSGTVNAQNRASAQMGIFPSATGPCFLQPAVLFTRSLTMVRDGRGLIAITREACHFDSEEDSDDDHGHVYFSFKGSKRLPSMSVTFKKIFFLLSYNTYLKFM